MIGKLLYNLKLEYYKSLMDEETYKEMKSANLVELYNYFYPLCHTIRRRYKPSVVFAFKAILYERKATLEDVMDAVESAEIMKMLVED